LPNTPISGFPDGSPAQAGDQLVIARGAATQKLVVTSVGAAAITAAAGASSTFLNAAGAFGFPPSSPILNSLSSTFLNGQGAFSTPPAAPIIRATSGTSTSGSAGTSVASITASGSNILVDWALKAVQTNTANTALTVTVTYTDATTITETTVGSTAGQVDGNPGGLLRTSAGAFVDLAADTGKNVSSIAVVTAGTGTGTRAAIISAREVAP
jgi:hypothetical protein